MRLGLFSRYFKNSSVEGIAYSSEERRYKVARISDVAINLLLIKAAPKAGLIVSLLAVLFLLANQLLLEPLNFGRFSQVLPYFISGLAALLGLVVGFASFSMQNMTNSMASQLKKLEEELNGIEELLWPLKPSAETLSSGIFAAATRYASKALYYMMKDASDKAGRLLLTDFVKEKSDMARICQEFIEESRYRLSLFAKTGRIYSLAMASTTDFLIRLRFKPVATVDTKGDVKDFFDTMSRIHVLRNIASAIFIRHNISNLTYEMLFSTIPIIALVTAVSFVFSYEEQNPTMVRLVYAGTFSLAILPFILFAIRTIPLVYMTKNNSGLPFSHK